MNRKKVLMVIVLVAVVAAGGWVGYGAIKEKKTDKEIGVAAPLKLLRVREQMDLNIVEDFAQDKGFYKKHGVTVEPVTIEKPSDTRNAEVALMSGEVDVSIGGMVGSMTLFLNDANIKWLGNTYAPFGVFGVSRFPKERKNEIKKVGVVRFGGEPYQYAVAALRHLGIDPKSVQMVAIPTNDARMALLEKGELDFIMINSEQFLFERNIEGKHTVYGPEELVSGSGLYRGIVTMEKMLREKPQQLQGFINAIHDALQTMERDPQGTKEYLKEKYTFSDERAEKVYTRFIEARKGIDPVPEGAQIVGLVEVVRKELKPTNPTRDLEEFAYPEFARVMLTRDGK